MSDLFCFLDGFGGGGPLNKSILIVSVPVGSMVTATLGPQIKTAQEKNGEAWLRNLDVGEWNLKLTLGQQSATAKYNIERFGVYRTSMAFFAATIKITYPGGSTCTCSKDDRTYTAPDTSGTWDCVVDSAGDWTVAITADGQEPESRVVEITNNGQTVSIVIAYEIVLYDSGDQCIEVTGGWEIKKDSSDNGFNAEFKEDSILIKCGEYWTGGDVHTKATINRGVLTTLCADVSVSGGNNVDGAFHMEYGGSSINIPKGDNTVKLDIASINNQIVKFRHSSGGKANGSLIIKRVYIVRGDTV